MKRPFLTYPTVLLAVLLLNNCALRNYSLSEDQNEMTSEAAASTGKMDGDFPPDIAESDAAAGSEEIKEESAASPSADEKPVPASREENGDNGQGLLDSALELTEASQDYWAEGDVERSIEALDQAYSLLLQVNAENNPKLSQQKEDIRFMISKRIAEIYASRFNAVKGNHNEIPLTVNEHVEREIKIFQTVERDFFLESFRRSGRYRGEILKALKEAGLPEDLSWLPLIESGFKVKALSRSRALGLWQFIPSTGYKFGLKRNEWIDERMDPAKATAAAISYLKELHKIFGDWATVLAAYNCGEGSVLRVIRSQKINYLDNFWDLYGRLPRETARYYPRFLAALSIIKEPEKHGFVLVQPDEPLPFESVMIDKPINLKTAAEKSGISCEDISALNPELRRDATPAAPYSLRVSPGAGEALLSNLDKIPRWSPPKPSYAYHKVRRGETLSLIALRYRTSIQKIVDENRLRRGSLIRVGQRLKIPLRGAS